MRLGWTRKTIGDIAQVKGGKRVPKGYKLVTSPTAHPYITVSDFADDGTIDTSNLKYVSNEVFEQISRYTISSDDLYLSIAGTIGKTGFVPKALDGANLTENACKLVPTAEIDKKYLFYLTKSDDFLYQAGINTRVAAQPKLALERLKTILLPLPPLPEQKRIVAILDEAFAGIETAIANTEKNLANARELFDGELESLISRALVENDNVPLSDLALEITDGDHMPPPKSDTGVPFITIRNIDKDSREIDFSDTFKVPHEYFERLKSNRKPKAGDVLFTVTGSYGIPVLVKEGQEFCFQRHVGLIRPKEDVASEWLEYVLLSPQIAKQAHEGATGTAQKTVSLKLLRNFVLPKQNKKDQAKLVGRLNSLSSDTRRLKAICKQKLTALAELRQSLLQKAFSGELTAEAADEAQKAVA